jgi:3-oxoacyl-(acyl-carrier-protein) synthase
VTCNSHDVVVAGLGCVCSAGLNLSESLQGVFTGQHHPLAPRKFATTHPVTYPVFEVPDLFFHKEPAPGNSTHSLTVRYALCAAAEALQQAGLSRQDLKRLRVGTCIGTTVGSTLNSESFYREYLTGREPDMEPVRRFLDSNPASSVARAFGLHGPCQTVVNACSSGTDAIGIAAGWIQAGLCDVVVTGGADELCRVTYNGFASLKIMDATACRPFDQNRQGLNLGEGAGFMVLEAASLRDHGNLSLLGYVLGYGSACDAHHLTAPHPEGKGLRRALTEALRISRTPVSEIAFVNAHGTGTRDNDKVEGKTLRDELPGVPFLSTKGCTGHALGAAGGIEAVLTLACLNLGRIPASAGFKEADPEIMATPATRIMPITGNAAISQSLAFGGNNGVLVFGRD